jgi:hypothetical protein
VGQPTGSPILWCAGAFTPQNQALVNVHRPISMQCVNQLPVSLSTTERNKVVNTPIFFCRSGTAAFSVGQTSIVTHHHITPGRQRQLLSPLVAAVHIYHCMSGPLTPATPSIAGAISQVGTSAVCITTASPRHSDGNVLHIKHEPGRTPKRAGRPSLSVCLVARLQGSCRSAASRCCPHDVGGGLTMRRTTHY